MNNAFVQQYQTRVLGPSQTVEYSTIIRNSYPPQAVHQEPFIGIKVLCTDTNAYTTTPGERIRYIESNLGFLRGKGCIIRETAANKPDGFWIITLPAPQSQLATMLQNLMDVLSFVEQWFGIIPDGLYEVNVSGKCSVYEVESFFNKLLIPAEYRAKLIQPQSSPYRLGQIRRINNQFMVLRTRWTLGNQTSFTHIFEQLAVISQLLGSMYH